MRIGAFSDVHSNLEALKAVTDFLAQNGAQILLCGGDIVGYGPDPEACIELLQSLRVKVVAGNHDWGVAGRTPINQFNRLAAAALHWTRKNLKPAHRLFLKNLPLTFGLGPIHLVHAAPSAPEQWDYIFTLEEAVAEMGSFTAEICLIGHSHLPLFVEQLSGKQAREITESPFPLLPDGKYLISLGSVGQPRDGDPRACCVLIDLNEHLVSFYRLPYCITATQKKIRAFGLPEPLAERLAFGR
jgi:diadenosine tetraphosphatase ApaH/serine/threonine PP2A family protein phosphatase